MTAAEASLPQTGAARPIPTTRAPQRARWSATARALSGMIVRDLTVLDKNLQRFLPTAIMQPTLLVFVFTYLFPVIGQSIGGQTGSANFSTILLPGIVANSIIFVGVFSVGMNLILEIDAEELEDRVLAPAPIVTVAVAKIAAGALQALVAALIVFPIAAFLPSTPIAIRADWPILLTFALLASVTSASLGLALGVVFGPRSGPWLLSVVALPLSFFGCVFYTWDSLDPAPVVHYVTLLNPLVYMSEGLRAATVTGIPHMPVALVYPALAAFATVFAALGLVGFRRRMLR